MSKTAHIGEEQDAAHGSYASYTIGFLLSVLLTVVAFGLVYRHTHGTGIAVSRDTILGLVFLLAFAQLITQLTFFLHLGKESKPRWNLIVFVFMLTILIIVVGGTLWIMKHLNYTHLNPQQLDQYITHNEGIN